MPAIIGPRPSRPRRRCGRCARGLRATSAAQPERLRECARGLRAHGLDESGLADGEPARRVRCTTRCCRSPNSTSTPAKGYADPELGDDVDALRLDDDWYRVIGGERRRRRVIVSQLDSRVDFSPMLSGRVGQPGAGRLASTRSPRRSTAYTQTVGIYPESLQGELRIRTCCRCTARSGCRRSGTRCSDPSGGAAGRDRAAAADGQVDRRRACDPDVVTRLWRLGEVSAQASWKRRQHSRSSRAST